MENPTHSFREMTLALQLISESQIKSKTVMSWNSRKKKEGIFCTRLFYPIVSFLRFVVFQLNVQSIEYTSQITSYVFVACF